jgi:GNAT superfamily N-acetyltransferase
MLAEGLVWVADDAGELIGFAACQLFMDALHLWEIAVRHDRQGRGAGRALMAEVAEEARRRDAGAVTLSTFRDVAWNGPFYASLGYRALEPHELNGRLTAILMRERRLGLDVDARCAMRLDL